MIAKFLASAALLASLAVTANAAPIAPGSMLSFSDGATYNNTSITFLNDGKANISANVAYGSFAPAFTPGCTGCALFTSFTFAPTFTPTTIYSATLNGVTTTFELDTLTSVSTAAPFLDLRGSGLLTLTGYDPTPGLFFLSSQGPQNMNVTFSATTISSAVPEPMSLSLFGAGMAALGLLRRKRA